MTETNLPLAGPAASGVSRATAARAALDWRQLSHELRTPLNAILGNAELLLDGSSGPLSTQARARLGEVQTAGRQLLRQVQLLLTWLQLCAADPPLAPRRRVDLIALVREALAAAGLDVIQVEPPNARLWVCGDQSRLQMLVAEILALDGAGRALPKLRVGTTAGHSALGFAWPGFCAAQVGALQIALIETIARSHGAELALHPDGLSLLWLRQPPDWAAGAGSEDDPS